ncbi:MAG: nicotinate-nucleotide--dimethylbenzimidazole phosphoribosyltransferase, partial [Chloroflexi bacterium]|nr:nicotinate-nucleotide--dimethylbenzimidazole phosphoribosyltransferase [Chloroflexota bacterium]
MSLLNETLVKIKPLDKEAMDQAFKRQESLTKPAGSLGRLEDISIQLAGIQGRAIPKINKKAIITIAGDHAVASEGFHNWPQEVTIQMIMNIATGGAGVNALASHAGIQVIPVDMGVMSELPQNMGIINKKIGYGAKNIIKGPAMTREEAVAAIEAGIQLVLDEKASNGLDIVGTGEMGIGNTTPSSAICAVLTGVSVEEATGRGTGINDKQLAAKIAAIKEAIKVNNPLKEDPIDVL